MRFFIVFIFMIVMLNTNIYGENILDNYDAEEIEQAAEDRADISFKSVFEKVVNGDVTGILEDIGDKIKDIFFSEIRDNSFYIKSIIIISLLCGIFNTISLDIKDKSVSELVAFTGQILIITIAVTAFKETINVLNKTSEDIINIIASSIPLMTGIVVSCGKSAQAAASASVLTVSTGVITQIIKGIIIPFITITTLIRIVNVLSGKEMLNKMAKLFDDITGYIIKFGGYGFIFIMGLQRIGGATVNKLVGGSLKSVIGAVPVIGDIISGGAEVAGNIAATAASGTGVALIIIIIAISLVPVIKILIITAIYKLISAFAEPVCDKGTVEIIDSIGDGCKMIFAVLAMVIFMFVVSVIAVLGGLS